MRIPLHKHMGRFPRKFRQLYNCLFHQWIWESGVETSPVQKSFAWHCSSSLLLTRSPSMAASSQWAWQAGSGLWAELEPKGSGARKKPNIFIQGLRARLWDPDTRASHFPFSGSRRKRHEVKEESVNPHKLDESWLVTLTWLLHPVSLCGEICHTYCQPGHLKERKAKPRHWSGSPLWTLPHCFGLNPSRNSY